MTPDQLHEALYTIGWSQRDLGDRLRVDREMLRGWNQGTTEIPSRVGDWLEYLSDVHEQALLPSGGSFR
jgi:ribosome-binding protein aMBF1 (putative translation factor)